MSTPSWRICPGEWVLVTGANGFIASHTIDILLEKGYRVRGTLRNEKPWVNRFFDTKYGLGKFETEIVSSMDQESAFDKAVSGVSGIVHVAADVTWGTDADVIIPRVVAGTLSLLNSAAQTASVKSLVLTSSSSAVLLPQPNVEGLVVDENKWNDEAVKLAYSKDVPDGDLGFIVYAASKTQAEREAWKWVQEHQPKFAVNTVLPNFNMGPILIPGIVGSTMSLIRQILEGKTEGIDRVPPQWYADVRDNARVHIAALLDPNVNRKRIFAFAHPFNWTDVVTILKKLRPDNLHIPQAPEHEGRDLSDVRRASDEAKALIHSFFGVSGWISMEDSLAAGIADIKYKDEHRSDSGGGAL